MKWNIKRRMDLIFGDSVDFFVWKYRHLLTKNWKNGFIDDACINNKHREKLVDILTEKYIGVNSVLEIGSGSGQNLIMIKRQNPYIRCEGIEINKSAVGYSRKLIKSLNLDIPIKEGDFKKNIPLINSDVILSDAVLMYVSPKNLSKFLLDMYNRANSGLILCEQFSDAEEFYNDKWVHSLSQVHELFNGKVKVYDLEDYTRGDDWKKYGKIITIKKEKGS
jgi:SAM-dependent methyltransferase